MEAGIAQSSGWSVRQFVEAAISIFAIVNPIGNLPLFASLTEGLTSASRRSLFRLATLTALAVIAVMALAGQFLVETFFQLTLDQFAFAGGLVLVVVGTRRMVVEQYTQRPPLADDDARVRLAVSPIALPLLVGPGSIVNVMLIAHQQDRVFAVLACLAAFVGVFAVLRFSDWLYRLMGRIGTLAVGRVMQIFIVAMGVKFCFRALENMVHQWGIAK